VADYTYDAFVSYRKGKTLAGSWVQHYFAKQFEGWLAEELGEANVFWDQDDIEAGEEWPDRLAEAVRASRCLVAVLTPTYFKSRWCRWEWGSFVERRRLSQSDLVVPVGLHDGEWFPREVKALQELDFRSFFVTAAAFEESPLFIEYENALKRLAARVAKVVRAAPAPPAGGWPVAEAPLLEPPPIGQPRLRAA
jgi:hypothetical protein